MLYIMFFVALIGGGFAISLYSEKFCQFETFKSCLMSLDISQWGQTGDFFGGILNPFLTFIGLIFVIITIRQNQKALQHSKTELNAQLSTAEKQRFETTFFLLLSLFNEKVKDLKFFENSYPDKKNNFQLLYEELKEEIKGVIRTSRRIDEIEKINEAYTEFYKKNGDFLANYFDTLYILIKFIDDAEFSKLKLDKNFYIKLVSAQLSTHQLSLLFYTSLISPKILSEYKKFTDISVNFLSDFSLLLKKYPILKNLDKKTLANEAHFELLEYAKD